MVLTTRVVTLVADKVERQWLWCTDNPQNICEGVITNALQSCSIRHFHVLNVTTWGFSVYCGCNMNWEAAPCMGALCNWSSISKATSCGCKMNWAAASLVALCNKSSISKQTSHNHCLFSLYATMVTTLWLKQSTCFFQWIKGYISVMCYISKGLLVVLQVLQEFRFRFTISKDQCTIVCMLITPRANQVKLLYGNFNLRTRVAAQLPWLPCYS